MPNQTYVRYDKNMDALRKKKKKLLDKTQPYIQKLVDHSRRDSWQAIFKSARRVDQ